MLTFKVLNKICEILLTKTSTNRILKQLQSSKGEQPGLAIPCTPKPWHGTVSSERKREIPEIL